MTPIEALTGLHDSLPAGHHDRPGLRRAIEILRHGTFLGVEPGPARIDVTLWPRTGSVSVHEHAEADGSDEPKAWQG